MPFRTILSIVRGESRSLGHGRHQKNALSADSRTSSRSGSTGAFRIWTVGRRFDGKRRKKLGRITAVARHQGTSRHLLRKRKQRGRWLCRRATFAELGL